MAELWPRQPEPRMNRPFRLGSAKIGQNASRLHRKPRRKAEAMRYILTLTIGLLAAIGASATTASAHDYHRSHHAVEAKHSQVHHRVKHRFHRRAHKRAHHHRGRRDTHRRQSWSRQSRGRNFAHHVIVISHGGLFRIVRRFH